MLNPHWILAALMACFPVLALAQVYPESSPANRAAAGAYSLRNIALGEPRFANDQLYNLYDQGGSPMGLLETQRERAGLSFGTLGNSRATGGDTLVVGRRDYYLPQLSFSQAGIFAATLYFQRESENFGILSGDSVQSSATLFGLDMAAGPSSGLFRVGFGGHARLGRLEYSGEAERVLMEVPSLRFDIGSRLHPAVEIGVFAGFGGRFDSLESPLPRLQRYADITLPRYGMLADFGGLESIPAQGNLVLELGTRRFFGEANVNGIGTVYPIYWTGYWTLQTQWQYAFQLQDFRLAPAFRFARASESTQGYEGLEGNQDPFKKGDKIDALQADRSTTAFGLGGSFGFRDLASLLVEWETTGQGVDVDSLVEERYHRFSLGLEHRLDRLQAIPFPEGISLALRAGWTWRQDEKSRPGYGPYHFAPFVPSQLATPRAGPFSAAPDDPAGYGALHLGFGLGLFNDRLAVEGLMGFPGQLERMGVNRTGDASGTEFGLTVRYRVL